METVSVILSTYNGEKYILEQLKSLEEQSYETMTVYIHDDGSSDCTVKIINEFIKNKRNKKKFLLVEGEKNLGYPECFIRTLINSPKADYYAFCDQDDVWNVDKVERGVNRLRKEDSNIPLLYYAAVDYYNEKMEFIRHSKFATNLKKEPEKLGLQDFLFGGEPLGMTYVFNNLIRDALKEILLKEDNAQKDGFIKVFAASAGKIIYDREPVARYRRHDGATTGKENPSSLIMRYIMEGKSLFFDKNHFTEMKTIIQSVLENYSQKIPYENKKLLELFVGNINFTRRVKIATLKNRYRQVRSEDICYRLLFLIGRI